MARVGGETLWEMARACRETRRRRRS